MPAKLDWPEAMDTQLLQLRRARTAWDVIARTMGLSRNTVIERARRIGVAKRSKVGVAPPVVESDERAPRPAGHHSTWGAITADTVLDGAAYPFPVFEWP